MSALVANLLDMARLQSGAVRLNLEWQAPEEVIGTALRLCSDALRGHRVSTSLPPGLPLLRFDAVLLERVLCNLLENAAKYTPAGTQVCISVTIAGAWAQVIVADDGPGVASGQLEAIFDKFTRGERESAKPGVGLGLAICRAIVQAHGGKIHCERAALGGAAFVVALPLGQAPQGPATDIESRTIE